MPGFLLSIFLNNLRVSTVHVQYTADLKSSSECCNFILLATSFAKVFFFLFFFFFFFSKLISTYIRIYIDYLYNYTLIGILRTAWHGDNTYDKYYGCTVRHRIELALVRISIIRFICMIHTDKKKKG